MQPPQLSQQPTDSLTNALMLTCGIQLVRKRWRPTVSMALGRSSNYLLGSVLLAPDGSSRSNTMLMAPWTTTRPDWWPRAILSVLALITRRPSLPLSDTPPFTLSLLSLPWRILNFALWTFPMPTSMALLKRRSTCSSLRDLKWVDQIMSAGSGSRSMASSRLVGSGTKPFTLCYLLWASNALNRTMGSTSSSEMM